MSQKSNTSKFKAKLLRPSISDGAALWAFVVLPKEVSDILPRRGRTSVDVAINGYIFQTTLDPDGKLSHWLKIDEEQLLATSTCIGATATIEITTLEKEPEPALPPDFHNALELSLEAQAVWDETSAIAKVDWIHWIVTAKQAKTRQKRINDACDMLASGKKRVCCFDPSGFYSKALSAPKLAE